MTTQGPVGPPFRRAFDAARNPRDARNALGILDGGGGAPANAEYITGSADATLTNERVLTNTPSVTWDLSTPGQAKANAVAGAGPFQPQDATLTALAAFNTNGLLTQTAADTFTGRTITGPAAGITVSDGNGVAGNPTLALANDLAALEGLGGTNTIYYRSGTDAWSAVTVGSGLTFSSGTLASTSSGAILTAKIVTFGTSGTYTPTSGMKFCIIECIGAGGGGGGTVGTAAYNLGGGGGGSGGYSRKYATATDIGASKSVTVGSAGSGSSGGAGSAGGSSSVGTLCIANGGGGGGLTTTAAIGTAGAGGSLSGVAGDVSFSGTPGHPGNYLSIAASGVILIRPAGHGGASVAGGYGNGSLAGNTVASSGGGAVGVGSGGGGGCSNNAAANSAGGQGGVGFVIITEFIG